MWSICHLLPALRLSDRNGFAWAVTGFGQQMISSKSLHPQWAGLSPLSTSAIAAGQFPNSWHVPAAPLRFTTHAFPSNKSSRNFTSSPNVKCRKSNSGMFANNRNILAAVIELHSNRMNIRFDLLAPKCRCQRFSLPIWSRWFSNTAQCVLSFEPNRVPTLTSLFELSMHRYDLFSLSGRSRMWQRPRNNWHER